MRSRLSFPRSFGQVKRWRPSSDSMAGPLQPRLCCFRSMAKFSARPTSFRRAIRFTTPLKSSRACYTRWKRRAQRCACSAWEPRATQRHSATVFRADVALVETVAHTESAMHFFADPHVIVDVGGQDMKLIVLHDGRVKDFKLNTQCSAGNGYFLQSTAEGFGFRWSATRRRLHAEAMPVFGYGCAVFLQTDIVNFQRQGWRPKRSWPAWPRCCPEMSFFMWPRCRACAALGTRFILQGGTQNNLAAVKAEVDFLRASFRAAGKKPEIVVHPHCGESGAIGAAIEAIRLWRNGLHQLHRDGCGPAIELSHHAQRRDALPLSARTPASEPFSTFRPGCEETCDTGLRSS